MRSPPSSNGQQPQQQRQWAGGQVEDVLGQIQLQAEWVMCQHAPDAQGGGEDTKDQRQAQRRSRVCVTLKSARPATPQAI
jgi:hypothetical protein